MNSTRSARRRPAPPVAAIRLALLVATIAALALPTSAEAYLYWANNDPGHGTTFGRANVDGTSANQSFITAARDSIGLAVDGQHIYWRLARTGTATVSVKVTYTPAGGDPRTKSAYFALTKHGTPTRAGRSARVDTK